MATLTQTIARAKLPNETMTQTLHRLRKEGESITQTAGRLAREGDTLEAEVITAPENPTTVTGSEINGLEATTAIVDDIDPTLEEVTEPTTEETVVEEASEEEEEVELTPQQKGAITRAKNKAKKEQAKKDK